MRVNEHHCDSLPFRELTEGARQSWFNVGESLFIHGRELETPCGTALASHGRLRDAVQVADRVDHAMEFGSVLPRVGDGVVPRLEPEFPSESSHQDLAQAVGRERNALGPVRVEAPRLASDHTQLEPRRAANCHKGRHTDSGEGPARPAGGSQPQADPAIDSSLR